MRLKLNPHQHTLIERGTLGTETLQDIQVPQIVFGILKPVNFPVNLAPVSLKVFRKVRAATPVVPHSCIRKMVTRPVRQNAFLRNFNGGKSPGQVVEASPHMTRPQESGTAKELSMVPKSTLEGTVHEQGGRRIHGCVALSKLGLCNRMHNTFISAPVHSHPKRFEFNKNFIS